MNPFRQQLMSCGSRPPIGTWIMSASPLVAEALGHAGFDWCVVDMEHSPLDMGDMVHLLQAIGNTKMVPLVRVPSNEPVMVKRVSTPAPPRCSSPSCRTPPRPPLPWPPRATRPKACAAWPA